MTSLHAYSKYPWRQLEYSLNYRWPHLMNTQITHEVTSWVFKRPITSLHEFSNYPWRQHSNIQINHEHFEYSWSDVIGILNIHKVTSWLYSKTDFMGILEYPWSDVMGILNIQKKCNFEYVTWIFWIILNIHNDIGILNITEVMSWVFWIFKRSRVILNMNFKIPMTLASEYFHNVTSWVFKIPMTSPYEYSKYP